MTQVIPGEPLNILHTIDLDTLYPIIRCAVTFSNPIDLDRFKVALKQVGQIVPEIFAGYDLSENSWQIPDLNPDNLIHPLAATANVDAQKLDLLAGPQLNVYVQTIQKKQRLTFIMSHIFSDGAGFKQLLYLLADCYNHGETAIQGLQNHTDLTALKTLVAKRPPVQAVDRPKQPLFLPKLADDTPQTFYVNGQQLSVSTSQRLHQWAKLKGYTLNDIFMAVFGRQIQLYCGAPDITLPCPTDMRQYLPASDQRQLRIQNMTGRFNVSLKDTLNQPLAAIIEAVHVQMAELKTQKAFTASIRHLLAQSKTDSIPQLQAIVQQNYSVRPIAYTNFGVIDADKFNFAGSPIDNLLMTGSFRYAPMYQAVFSTFRNQITVGFNMVGNPLEINFGNALLQQIIAELTVLSYQ